MAERYPDTVKLTFGYDRMTIENSRASRKSVVRNRNRIEKKKITIVFNFAARMVKNTSVEIFRFVEINSLP